MFKEEEDIPQPDYEGGSVPQTLNKSRSIEGVHYVAGLGDAKKARVMFIAPALLKEEGASTAPSVTGKVVKLKPCYMKGAAGTTLRDCMTSAYLNFDEECYYTTVCKWLLPRANRIKPTKTQVEWAEPMLRKEIKKVNPEIIVCMGKLAFDLVLEERMAMKDARGAWFWSEEYKCKVYLMEDPTKLSSRPEMVPTFINDGRQIRRMLDKIKGLDVPEVELHYRTIKTADDLRAWVDEMMRDGYTIFSLDCEWGGNNHIDGKLRSTQLAWKPGHGIYIRFMDEEGNYAFDVPYMEAGEILKPLLDNPRTKYVAHHASADLPWLHTWLGLEWYNKTLLDTEFAQQCCDESEELSLNNISMKYTDLGKYDIDLIRWKRANKQEHDAGYSLVPDDILIPYAIKDVDACIRAYPILLKEMIDQGVARYYFEIFNPFTTNVFTNFVLLGLPLDVELMEDLRKLYSYVRDQLNLRLQEKVYKEAEQLIADRLFISKRTDVEDKYEAKRIARKVKLFVERGEPDEAWKELKAHLTDPKVVPHYRKLLDHLMIAKHFNIRSGPHMKRWLFDVKRFTPVKSTANREKGLLSLPWEKVLALPDKAQAQYTPAVDKQSLEILAETNSDGLLNDLILLSAVGNICKAFLKEATIDSDGELVKENGLLYHLCSDGRIHGQYSTTETGRPRSWKPNALNLPKWVHPSVEKTIQEVLTQDEENGTLPIGLRKYVGQPIPSVRSCIKAPPGWCFVECDYQTAEVRGLAFISGDQALIDIMTKPDTQFGICKETEESLRLNYGDTCGITKEEQDEELLVSPDDPRLLKEDGKVVHPSADLHWSLAEIMYNKPREKMDKDIERSAAKVGNFQSMYGASAETLERKIEQDTGHKPEEGTGERILMALAKRQPVATFFLKSMEEKPSNPGYLIAESGRKRRFATHERMGAKAENDRAADSLVSALGREARNFFMQTSVADTSARAGNWLLDHYIKKDMQCRPMAILYDALVTLCPLDEAEEVAGLHQKYMCDDNTWTYHDRIMNYPIDPEVLTRWSTKLKDEDKKYLGDLVDKIK